MGSLHEYSRASMRALTAAVALVAVTLGSSVGAGAETLRVGKAGRTAFSFVPVDVGVKQGFFKKHGLDIEISSFAGDARVQQAMAADSIDIGLGSGPGLAFIAKGSPIKGVAGMAGPPLLFALIVRNDGEIKTLDDLKGKKVGVSTPGSVTNWIINEVGRQKGWGAGGMTQVNVGEDAARLAALKAKALEAAIVNLGVALTYADSGEGRIILRFNELVKDFHIHVIFATNKTIAEKPDALRRFLAGWFESIEFMRKNKAETVKIAMEVMDTNEKITSQTYDELMPMFSDDGKFNPKAMAVLASSFVEMNTLTSEPDTKTLINESFLPKK